MSRSFRATLLLAVVILCSYLVARTDAFAIRFSFFDNAPLFDGNNNDQQSRPYPTDPTQLAPLLSAVDADHLPDQYIVVLKDHVDLSQSLLQLHQQVLLNTGVLPQTGVYSGIKDAFQVHDGIKGYFGHFNSESVEYLRAQPEVSSNSLILHFPILPTSDQY